MAPMNPDSTKDALVYLLALIRTYGDAAAESGRNAHGCVRRSRPDEPPTEGRS